MRARFVSGAAAFALLVAGPLAAQRGQPDPGRRGGMDGAAVRMAPGAVLDRQVEAALNRRDELGLTEGQVAELETLRSDIEGTFAPLRSELEEARSQARDRSGTRDEARARMTEVRERQRALHARIDTVRSPLQARFEQIVPPLQRQELQRRARGGRGVASVGGRNSALRGAGLRAGRAPARATIGGVAPRGRGPRVAPGGRLRAAPRVGPRAVRGMDRTSRRRPLPPRGGGR